MAIPENIRKWTAEYAHSSRDELSRAETRVALAEKELRLAKENLITVSARIERRFRIESEKTVVIPGHRMFEHVSAAKKPAKARTKTTTRKAGVPHAKAIRKIRIPKSIG